MIAAFEALDFIPRGRQAVAEHPGPLVTKSRVTIPAEHLLLHRLQNVNISHGNNGGDASNEFWQIREIYKEIKPTNQNSQANSRCGSPTTFMSEFSVNAEEELYYKGHTAVWTRGLIVNENEVLPHISFTCDTPISHAFFCAPHFIRTQEPDKRKIKKDFERKYEANITGICLIDSTSLRVYLNTGEDYITSLEFAVSNTWSTKFGILLEKNPSSTTIDSQAIHMPRLFSLTHPLDEMCPVLIKSNVATVCLLTGSDYRVIYADEKSDLVLMYDNKIGKHFVAVLRQATVEEKNIVASVASNDSLASGLSFSNQSGHHTGQANLSHNSSTKFAGTKHHSSLHAKSSIGSNLTQSPFSQRLCSNLTATPPVLQTSMSSTPTNRIQSPLARLQSTMGQSFSIQDMRKVGQAQPSKPIIPELCLEHIWTENVKANEYMEAAAHGFLHVDLIGQLYMCYLLPRTLKLQLTRMERSNAAEKYIFGVTTSILARDAVCLDKMKMMAILAPCGTLMLYSGPHQIGKVHVGGVLSTSVPASSEENLGHSFLSSYPRRSSLLPSSQDAKFEEELHMLSPVHPLQPQFPIRNGYCCALKDPAGNRLTMIYPGGRMYRIALPLISESPFVIKCLVALRQVLQKDLAIQLMAKWFGVRNAPGSTDLNPHQEWQSFENVLLELLGRPYSSDANHLKQSTSSNSLNEPKKRRKGDNCEGTNEDYEFMMNFLNKNAKKSSAACAEETLSLRNDTNAILFPYLPKIFFTLHLVYEEIKLDDMMSLHLGSLAEFLYKLAIDLQLDSYCLHYFLDFPQLAYSNSVSYIGETEAKKFKCQQELSTTVPSIFKHIHDIVQQKIIAPYPHFHNVNDMSSKIIQLAYIITTGNVDVEKCVEDKQIAATGSKTFRNYDDLPINTKIVKAFLDLRVTRQDIERLPTSLSYLFSEALEHSRIEPPIKLGSRAFELLLRPDLLEHATFDSDRDNYEYNITYRNVQKEHSLSPKIAPIPDVIPKSDVILGEDGMEHMDTKLLSLRFPNDLRINEVRRLLGSSKPVPIDVVQSLGVSDHDFIEEQEKQLYSICTRTMALPMGRGMFTLRTCTPTSTESLTIPKLCLSGKETSKGATVELQQIEVPPNMNMWPIFHNGVAAGLQVTPDAKDIDSTWIVYNKPKGQLEGSTEHAGFLMALGLNGHLKTLSFMSTFEYLVKCDEMTSVGLLLGISAAHRGTMDTTTTKLLSVHIEALLPATAVELDIPQNIQVAALMGIGMIYQGTAKRHIAEILLQEIGRPPGPEMENCVERESYALTAGLALGLVTLGQGESPTGLRDLQLPDTLHYYMIGGNKRPLTGSQKEKYKLPSFQVREGETVNIDVTAPGATLALGLMFFKTGNKAVANWMKPPETSYLLDLVRPDLLLLRVVARGLIMWDSIKPTCKWLANNFPIDLAFDLHRGPVNIGPDYDHEAGSQAYCNIIAGAALCIGLRYAGTANEVAYNTLKDVMDLCLNMSGYYIGEYSGKITVESLVVLVLIAMSLVFAGTGEIRVLRLCRMLRARLGTANSHVTYGSQMSIHMAVGFLFLGGGRFTLSRSPQAVAALVCALFPKFPTHSNDNRYHLQAFRHLYVLAVEPRIFLPRDIDTGKLCLCNVTCIKLNSTEIIELPLAPCILPELDTLQAVYVQDSTYWTVCFERGKNWDQLVRVLEKCGCIDVKQKAGCLSHLDDPDRLKSLLAQTLTSEQYSSWKIDTSSLLSFTNNQKVINFTTKFLSTKMWGDKVVEKSVKELETIQILTLQFYNCLTKDHMHALPIYLDLFMILRKFETNKTSNYDIWQFKIISTILNVHKKNILLSAEYLRSMNSRLKQHIEQWTDANVSLLKQYLFSSTISFLQETELSKLLEIASIVTFYELPINSLNCVDLGGQLNYLRMLVEFKKLKLETGTINFISKVLMAK